MDAIKNYLIETGLKTLGPSAVRGGILGIAGWLLAKNNMLAPFGIISDAATHSTTIHWEQLSTWAIGMLPALLAAGIKLLNHHADQVVTSVTQPKPAA